MSEHSSKDTKNTRTIQRIAVIGGGIGGLTFAIAMRQHGIEVDIYEQTQELREVGAAVALSANATRFSTTTGAWPNSLRRRLSRCPR